MAAGRSSPSVQWLTSTYREDLPGFLKRLEPMEFEVLPEQDTFTIHQSDSQVLRLGVPETFYNWLMDAGYETHYFTAGILNDEAALWLSQ